MLGKGVEIDGLKNNKFLILDSIKKFLKNKGTILVCGTCLQIRQKEKNKICPVSTMEELLKIVEESDKVITFG